MHLYIEEHLIFYIHDVHTNGIKKKEYTNMFKQLKIYTYYSMNKQYEEGVQKWKKSLLDVWK